MTNITGVGGHVTNTTIDIRDEQPADVAALREVHRLAFGQDEEGRIVEALRASGAATLSLVATDQGAVVGHILFSPVHVASVQGAGLGPMAVIPARQRQGIGSRLVGAGIERLRSMGHPFVVVLGHPVFYARFGFQSAVSVGLTCEWEVPADVFMVRILDPEFRDRLKGLVQYRVEFSAPG